MSCTGCREVAVCYECGVQLAPDRAHVGLCARCALVVQLRELALVEEDPDRRPYTWDLES